MKTDWVQAAKNYVDHSENANADAVATFQAERATACALIAIAQELRVMNAHNTGAMELEWTDLAKDVPLETLPFEEPPPELPY